MKRCGWKLAFSIFSSGGYLVHWSGAILAILEKEQKRNISVKSFWTRNVSRWHGCPHLGPSSSTCRHFAKNSHHKRWQIPWQHCKWPAFFNLGHQRCNFIKGYTYLTLQWMITPWTRQNSKTISCGNWILCFSKKKLKILRKIRPVACNDYNSQTISHENWIFCLLVSDFQQRIRK